MSAKNSNGRKAPPVPSLPIETLLRPATSLPPMAPDNGLSAGFAAALGKKAGSGNGLPAGAVSGKSQAGASRPDQINKASKPVAGANGAPPRRSGHR